MRLKNIKGIITALYANLYLFYKKRWPSSVNFTRVLN